MKAYAEFNETICFQLENQTYDLIGESRKIVDELIAGKSSIYGINTGFGKFATTVIPGDQLE